MFSLRGLNYLKNPHLPDKLISLSDIWADDMSHFTVGYQANCTTIKTEDRIMTQVSRQSFSYSHPQQTEVLISCFDWARFSSFSRHRNSAEIFQALDEFYKISERVVHAANGKIIKFIGDAGLAIFPEEFADSGIVTLASLKQEIDQWMKKQGIDSFLHVNCHFGEVTIVEMGGAETRQLDLIGENVNLCFVAVLEHGFTITPQAFRWQAPKVENVSGKYTPPIVYRLSS